MDGEGVGREEDKGNSRTCCLKGWGPHRRHGIAAEPRLPPERLEVIPDPPAASARELHTRHSGLEQLIA